MAHGTLRLLAMICHFMIFASAVIVTGLLSYFLNRFPFRGAHLVYGEVVAVMTLVLYLFAMVLPLFSSYAGYFLPINFIFSYLWLTAFIFSAVDWSGRLCSLAPLGTNKCGLKRTVEAFNFIAFFFLLCNIFVEALLWRAHRKEEVAVKPRPSNGQTEDSATPAVQP
ncbi:Uncharacterized protein TCAP_06264 [Tolypocladium capitatum]|uniref:MARVEL domain-containing protein n=1 Tax=Tolypocladium capitatum TaxID=45235 RepID=A0A2K3Q8H6_9HYPO|nr:Uncharacterized protein TCAP_06264 [Tolypocladium capitatum]